METDIKCQYSEICQNSENIDNMSPSVKAALNKIAEKEGYIYPKIFKRTISTEGNNYLGILFEIDIKGDTAEGSKETNLFVKHVLPANENFKLLSIDEVYSKETFAYRELAKIFNTLQNEANVPLEDRFNMVPSYESVIDAIVLENMTKKGFKTYGRMDIMSISYAKLCIQQLAKFHGLSFVIERRMPIFFENKIKSLKQSLLFEENFEAFAKKMYDTSTANLSPGLKARLDNNWKKMFENYKKYMESNATSVKCLCHGDFKMNNILHKENEGDITKVIPVDYQLLYYGHPVMDLIYFMFHATDQNFRRNYFTELKDLYHESLKLFLEYFDIQIDEVYSRKMFERDFEDCLGVGLVNTVLLLPFLFTTKEDTPDLSKDDLVTMDFRFDDQFEERLRGTVEDFIEWGYL